MKLFFTTLVIFLIACGSKSISKPSVFTDAEWSLMQNADSVKLFRLKQEGPEISPMDIPNELRIEQEKKEPFTVTIEDTVSGYKEFYAIYANKMQKEEKDRLFPFLENSTKAFNKSEGKCDFQPGAAIKFYKGSERFYLLMCFNCNIWAFERQGVMYYVEFDKGKRKELVKYAKDLFPLDSDFQNLKE